MAVFLPLAIAAAAGGGYTWWELFGKWEGGVKPGPSPAAPQTRQEMVRWTPEMQATADREKWREWAPTAITGPRSLWGGDDQSPDPLVLAAAAVGAVSLFLIARN